MKVNKELMAKARFERKPVSELTVKEFRALMQQCFDADRNEVQRRKTVEYVRLQRISMGLPPEPPTTDPWGVV